MEYNTGQVRLFIAAELSPQHHEQIHQFKKDYEDLPWLRWVEKENLHLTVLFLGNVNRDLLENLISLFRVGFETSRPIRLISGKWSWAPDKQDPRMIWIRFARSQEFSKLVKDSYRWFSQIQRIPQQRIRPIPHITVARFRPEEKSPINLDLRQIDGAMKINSLTLWKSDVGESGMRYTQITTFRLGGKE